MLLLLLILLKLGAELDRVVGSFWAVKADETTFDYISEVCQTGRVTLV